MGLRKNQARLSAAEKKVFVDACLALKAQGVYDMFVRIHLEAFQAGVNDPAHGGPAFLPWHREYLRRFERELQRIDSRVWLPYWDWTVDRSPDSSLWSADFLGGNGDSSDRVTTGSFASASGRWELNVLDPGESRRYLRRAFGAMGALATANDVAAADGIVPYDSAPWNRSSSSSTSFRNRLEGSIHNPAHMWVGGSMMDMSSPNDPVFWLHHCNVDRLWARWQRDHVGEPFVPTSGAVRGHNLNDPMSPWGGSTTVASTLDHHALQYTYDEEPVPSGPSAQGDRMAPGQVLRPGEFLRSPNGLYTFVYQGDGNLVLYGPHGWLWDSETDWRPVGVCIMQTDGNLVLYGPGPEAVWDSSTWQYPGSSLAMQDDGNVVIYRPDGVAVWATNTVQPPPAEKTTVPDVREMDADLAGKEILSTGLKALYSTSSRPAWVWRQSPAGGTTADVGSSVLLTLQKGPIS